MALFENLFHGVIRAPLLPEQPVEVYRTDRPMPMPLVFGLVLPANFFAVLAIFDKDRWMRAECPIREARSERNSFRRAAASAVEKYFGGERAEPGGAVFARSLLPVSIDSQKGKGQQFDHVRCQCGRRPLRCRPTVRRPATAGGAHAAGGRGSRRSGDGAAGVAFPAAFDAGAGASVFAHPADLAGFAVRIGCRQLAACT